MDEEEDDDEEEEEEEEDDEEDLKLPSRIKRGASVGSCH